MMVRAAGLAALLAIALCGPLHAQPKPDPDWPCVQRRVPTLSAAAFWQGSDLGAAGRWDQDAAAAALARKLASRRTQIEEFDPLLDGFVKDAGPDKASRLMGIFTGALEIINAERARILAGIGRYAEGQRRLAERIREEADRITAVKDAPDVKTPKELEEVETRFTWDKRIFEERSQSLAAVCEVPVLLEQRLGEIARRIQQRL